MYDIAFNKEYELAVERYAAKILYNDGLTLKNTSLPNCTFLGLFAKKAFKKGAVVCKYVGDKYRTVDAIRLKDKSYLMRLGEQSYVNAEPYKDVYAR